MERKDMIPPHDDEMERALLGCLLAEGFQLIDWMILEPFDFYSRANMRIFEAMQKLHEDGFRADILTTVHKLKDMGVLDEAGGASYVSALTTVVPSSANAEYYAQCVLNYSSRRRLLKLASSIGVAIRDETTDIDEFIASVQKDLKDIVEARV